MAFSNPFDDPQGAFYILRNAQGQFSLWLIEGITECHIPTSHIIHTGMYTVLYV